MQHHKCRAGWVLVGVIMTPPLTLVDGRLARPRGTKKLFVSFSSNYRVHFLIPSINFPVSMVWDQSGSNTSSRYGAPFCWIFSVLIEWFPLCAGQWTRFGRNIFWNILPMWEEMRAMSCQRETMTATVQHLLKLGIGTLHLNVRSFPILDFSHQFVRADVAKCLAFIANSFPPLPKSVCLKASPSAALASRISSCAPNIGEGATSKRIMHVE